MLPNLSGKKYKRKHQGSIFQDGCEDNMNIKLSSRKNQEVRKVSFPLHTDSVIRREFSENLGFMEKRTLQDGFSVYLTDFAPTVPITISSDSWPVGFSWVFFLSGQALYSHKSLGRTIEMKSGMNRLAFQGGAHGFAQFYPGAPVRIITITASRERFDKLMAADISCLPKSFQQDNPDCHASGAVATCFNSWEIQSALFRLSAALGNPPAPKLLVEGIVLELIGRQILQISRAHPPELSPAEREKIIQARELLVQAMDAPPKLTELALLVGLAPNRLSRGFKVVYGSTPFAHLREVRLNHAYKLLSTGKTDVTEACFAVGYDSLSHFSKAFFRQFREKPSEVKSRIISSISNR